MINRFRRRILIFPLLLLCLASLLAVACSSNKARAKDVIAEYLKNQGTRDLTVDLFYTDPNFPDKAYTSATVTYNFATSKGTFQQEFLGFILARDGNAWRIERTAGYTKEEQKAATYLAGGK